jgi:hypothetical protein
MNKDEVDQWLSRQMQRTQAEWTNSIERRATRPAAAQPCETESSIQSSVAGLSIVAGLVRAYCVRPGLPNGQSGLALYRKAVSVSRFLLWSLQ